MLLTSCAKRIRRKESHEVLSQNRIPQIIFGCDAAKETGKELQNQCVTRCLIVTDKGVRAAGLVDPILASLDACGISYIIFDDVKPETPDTVCLELAETIRNNQLDGVLAIGGGSAIDTAKAAARCPGLPPMRRPTAVCRRDMPSATPSVPPTV